jgi:hypothetical protein
VRTCEENLLLARDSAVTDGTNLKNPGAKSEKSESFLELPPPCRNGTYVNLSPPKKIQKQKVDTMPTSCYYTIRT